MSAGQGGGGRYAIPATGAGTRFGGGRGPTSANPARLPWQTRCGDEAGLVAYGFTTTHAPPMSVLALPGGGDRPELGVVAVPFLVIGTVPPSIIGSPVSPAYAAVAVPPTPVPSCAPLRAATAGPGACGLLPGVWQTAVVCTDRHHRRRRRALRRKHAVGSRSRGWAVR